MNDVELLRAYAGRASEDAFTLLVNRYVNLVYSAALRQTGDARDAEEITQAVFLILARKAGAMRQDTVLSGWLLRTTRFVSLNARRREINRIQLEREAMNLYPTESDAAWKKIAPLLDEALVHLSDKDRAAVVLRFFEDKSFKEIGQTMGLTDDGAQKRVARAVEKLRADFARRGLALPAALITGAMVAGAIQAAPSHLAASVTSAAFAGTAVAANALAKITLSAWDVARLKLLVLQGSTVALVAALIWVTATQLNSSNVGPTTSAKRPAPVVAGVATTPSPATLAPTPAQPAGGETMRFHVVDAASQAPVINARLTLVWTTGFLQPATNVVVTDNDGTALLPVNRAVSGYWSARIEVFQDGFVPKFVRWSEAQGDNAANIPAEYTTKLTRAVEIGGVVVNDSGEPVAGARVVFNAHQLNGQKFSPEDSVERECLTLGDHYHVEVTDSRGRWHCSHVPEQFGLIYFVIYHPDYAAATFRSLPSGGLSISGSSALAAADYRNGTAIMPLRRGVELAGLVVDGAGIPVAGAKVTANRNWADPTATKLTGADGRFRFASSPQILTVQAEGYGPADREIDPEHPQEETRFVLYRGAVLRGLVADEEGHPVADAKVEVSSGNGASRYEWSTRTDEKGKFKWLSAPTAPESYFVEAHGYKIKAPIPLTADGSEQKVTLSSKPPPVRFSGNVTDAETGKPVDEFTVWMSTEEAAYTGYSKLVAKFLPLRIRAAGKAGDFSFTNSGDVVEYAVEVRAEGYRSGRLTGRGPVTNDASLDFPLQRGASFAGVVLMPDGHAAEGAVAILCTEEPRPISPQRGQRNGGYMTTQPGHQSGGVMRFPREFDLGSRHEQADDQGRFLIPSEYGLKKILFFNTAGFNCIATEQLAASPTVTLLPWGRVTGVLKIGNQLGANQMIDLVDSYMPYAEWNGYGVMLDTKTDAQGRFSFEGLPPGNMRISHRLSFRDGQIGPRPNTQETTIHVQAGETTQVTLGGTGWKVVGRLRLKGPERAIDWRREVQRLDTKMAGPATPDRKTFASVADYQEAVGLWQESERAFLATKAGQQAQHNQRRYVLDCDADGSFKIDDVVPGTYELRILVTDPNSPAPQIPDPRKAIGTLTLEIVIPEITNGADGARFDLGELQLN